MSLLYLSNNDRLEFLDMHKYRNDIERAQKLRARSHSAEQRTDLMRSSPHKRCTNGDTVMMIISCSEAPHPEI